MRTRREEITGDTEVAIACDACESDSGARSTMTEQYKAAKGLVGNPGSVAIIDRIEDGTPLVYDYEARRLCRDCARDEIDETGGIIQQLAADDVVIRGDSRQKGKVGYVRWILGGELTIRWSTRSWVLPEVRDTGENRWVHIMKGARSSGTLSPATAKRYDLRRVSDELLAEWRARHDAIEEREDLGFSEKHAAQGELREEVADRAERLAVS